MTKWNITRQHGEPEIEQVILALFEDGGQIFIVKRTKDGYIQHLPPHQKLNIDGHPVVPDYWMPIEFKEAT